jgi:hypothetical protein
MTDWLQVIYLLMALAIVAPAALAIIGRWLRRRRDD